MISDDALVLLLAEDTGDESEEDTRTGSGLLLIESRDQIMRLSLLDASFVHFIFPSLVFSLSSNCCWVHYVICESEGCQMMLKLEEGLSADLRSLEALKVTPGDISRMKHMIICLLIEQVLDPNAC